MINKIVPLQIKNNMIVELENLKDLQYNEIATLAVIQKDNDLLEIFSDDIKMSFSLVVSLARENKLSQETSNYIRVLFDKIILNKPQLIDWYLRFLDAEGIKIETPPIIPIESPKPKVKKERKPKAKVLPRRYGKAHIMIDIEKQGGKATNAQLTALEVNDLKNIYVNLSTRLINDMLGDTKKLTDEDYREIRATIGILKNKTKKILKK
jgi:hypothetical protein